MLLVCSQIHDTGTRINILRIIFDMNTWVAKSGKQSLSMCSWWYPKFRAYGRPLSHFPVGVARPNYLSTFIGHSGRMAVIWYRISCLTFEDLRISLLLTSPCNVIPPTFCKNLTSVANCVSISCLLQTVVSSTRFVPVFASLCLDFH